ncbi:translation initiation factor eIF-2B subunit alpha [Mycoemilia scoparia]|uniref:Translation initiation factor eIF2B subunit alpha n=1 Tax=Mycoemilia scoparia TaxID=417184 RepID=A0A9W8A1L5_9FUNG|nr:translation initiation factor eIF-2B subunit alpha [Mycoemilia scoparia]
MPAPIAAIRSLMEYTKHDTSKTIHEFNEEAVKVASHLKESLNNSISISAGCDIFMRRTTKLALGDVMECKQSLLKELDEFLDEAKDYRNIVAKIGSQFIRDGHTILVHSYSRAILSLLKKAADQNKRFRVYVTESRPDCSGIKTAQELRSLDIPTKVILDTAVGYIIEKVDLVLVGAEGVVENGGLINKVGTYQLAIVAKEAKKPLYALTESYKFVRLYPLNQYDLPSTNPALLTFEDCDNDNDDDIQNGASEKNALKDTSSSLESQIQLQNPTLDYTPPEYITFLFTNLGVMTPSGVSDELIKFYYV